MFRAFIILSFLVILPVAAQAQENSLKMAVPSEPLDEPIMESGAFDIWIGETLCKALTFGAADYKQAMQEASKNFTKEGWKGYTSAVLKSHILDTITAKQQTATPTPCPSPVLLQKGAAGDRYRWDFQATVLFDFNGGTQETPSEEYNLKFSLERTPSSENPTGMGIDKWEWRKVSDDEMKGSVSHEATPD